LRFATTSKILRRALKAETPPDVVVLRLQTAQAQLGRGSYRGAALDAVTAVEIRADRFFQALARRRSVGERMIAQVRGFKRFDDLFKIWVPGLRGPDVVQLDAALWQSVYDARTARHAIAHRGESIDASEAKKHVGACAKMVELLDSFE
jgi:hypothetical protein